MNVAYLRVRHNSNQKTIPIEITREQVISAFKWYDDQYPENDYTPPGKKKPWTEYSTHHWAVWHNDKFYPPKAILRQIIGEEKRLWGGNLSGQANAVLRELGFTVWARSTTLGHAKSFWWKIDKDCNITFKRKFNTRIGAIPNTTVISVDILLALLTYLPNDKWFMLSHNVVLLANGTEVDGIGKFLHSQGFTTTESQIASHLATVFYRVDVWRYNGKRRGMKFQKKCDVTNWCECLRHYYLSLLSNEDV